ncbi:hypothetical protein [Couchioplanes azureus]|uniref:hypothetical protein n=1 Tax=Couchioplanes caeruleus TaxID=56438 RepID=UPI00166FC21B|nr:hypothetical protein [Couchioplanes caeruleus]GGQ43233.1 hypothetical protein GCM10010166_09430 [Couchioplanes caeruleus subsp. azureus]
MGSLSDNGGGWPGDGGSPDGLPGLPEEWGVIVVPDDLSELSDEVTAVQAELHRARRQTRWQRFADRPGIRVLRRLSAAGLRAPVLIISMAIVVTIASLFASAWSGPSRSPATQRSANTTDEGPEMLPALELIGTDGQPVPLRGQLPAVILLTEGCDCDKLVAETIAAVQAGIAVVTVHGPAPAATRHTPATNATPQAQGKTVLELRDPAGGLRSATDLNRPDGTAAVLLVGRTGEIVRKVPRAATVAVFEPDLARLPAG